MVRGEKPVRSALRKKQLASSIVEPVVDSEMVQLGKRLRELRLARGLGVRKLARDTNVSPSLISHIELGRGAPSVKTLYALVAALDVPVSEMFITGAPPIAENNAVPKASARVASSDWSSEKPRTGFIDPARGSNAFVQRVDDRRRIQLEHGFRWECLTPGTDVDVEFMETIIEVGGGNPESEMKTHNGTEYGLVQRGTLGVKIAFETFLLKSGDSIRFESNLPHCMWNAGDEPVHSIWFVRGRST
jgi:transcriptional regulator with XRE-family HTH domain